MVVLSLKDIMICVTYAGSYLTIIYTFSKVILILKFWIYIEKLKGLVLELWALLGLSIAMVKVDQKVTEILIKNYPF